MLLKDVSKVIQPKVTPDPAVAAELERRREALAYRPENAFHRDTLQRRVEETLPSLPRRQA